MRLITRPGRSRKEWLRDEANAWLADPQSVYVMVAPDGRVKVGIAGKVDRRRVALEVETRVRLRVAFSTEPTRFAKEIEAACHETLAPHRIAGEWFAADAADSVIAVQTNFDAMNERNTRTPERLPSYRSGPTV